MREEIQYISPYNLVEPFYINIAGISYCDGSYHIYRPKSAVFCMEYIFSGSGTLNYLGTEYHPKEGDVNTGMTTNITATHASLGKKFGSTRPALSSESLCAPTV